MLSNTVLLSQHNEPTHKLNFAMGFELPEHSFHLASASYYLVPVPKKVWKIHNGFPLRNYGKTGSQTKKHFILWEATQKVAKVVSS